MRERYLRIVRADSRCMNGVGPSAGGPTTSASSVSVPPGRSRRHVLRQLHEQIVRMLVVDEGCAWYVSPVWNTWGEPRPSSVKGSREIMPWTVSRPAPTGRAPASMNQFCDSQAEKSVNLRCW